MYLKHFILSLIVACYIADVTAKCAISSSRLHAIIRRSYALRAECEGASFRSAVCSVYWAEQDEIRIISARYQKCMETNDASYRSWVYGNFNSGLPGFFSYQALLDRAILAQGFQNVTGEQQTFAQEEHDTTLAEFLSNLATASQQLKEESTETLAAVASADATLTAAVQNAESVQRGHVDAQAQSVQDLDVRQEFNSSSLVHAQALNTRTNISLEHSSTRSVLHVEAEASRKEEDAQSSITQANTKKEQSDTRNDEDLNSGATVSLHTSVISATLFIVNTEIDNQLSQTRVSNHIESASTQTRADSDYVSTRITEITEEKSTRVSAAAVVDADATSTQSADTAEEGITDALVQQSQDALRSSVTASFQAIDANLQMTKSAVDGLITNSAQNTSLAAAAAEQQNQNVFQRSAVTPLTSLFASLATLPTNVSTSGSLMGLLVHLNLAGFKGSWLAQRFVSIEMFARPEGGYFASCQAVVNDTVSYCAQRYGRTHCGNAASLYAAGNVQAAAQNYRSALQLYQQAYKDATTST